MYRQYAYKIEILCIYTYKHQRRQWHPTPVLLPGKSHGWRSLEGCSPWGCWGSDTTERLHFHFSLSCIGEGNGNLLQCSCLENPRDGGAWWAAVYGAAQSQTRLKQLGSSSSRDYLLTGPFHLQKCPGLDYRDPTYKIIMARGKTSGLESPLNSAARILWHMTQANSKIFTGDQRTQHWEFIEPPQSSNDYFYA